MKKYKITLADGTVLSDLELNGNNFISATKVDTSTFAGKLSSVTINDGTKDEVHSDMALVQITAVGTKYWFVLRDLTDREKSDAKTQANIEYIAMMSNIELGEV